MENLSVRFQKFKVLDGSMLKLIAVITMLIDHIGAYFLAYIPKNEQFLFSFLGREITFYYIARFIGRTAFPIFAFLITEGYIHTSNRKRYGINLFIFALVSEIPFNYARSGALLNAKQNVFWTLLLGYLGLCFYEKFSDKPHLKAVSVLGLMFVAWFFKADYGAVGYALILLLYVVRQSDILKTVFGTVILNEGLRPLPAFLFISMYNKKRGFVRSKFIKYAFYAFYPVHLVVIGILRQKYLA